MFVYWIHLPEHFDVTTDGYVGIATNFEQRMFAHKSCAKTGKEQTLYKAIRKYGWENLVKEVILISNENYCLEIEKKLRTKERIGWNIAIGGGEISGANLKGVKQSEQHLANRKKALIGRVSGMKGKFHSEEAKNKSRQANIGKVLTNKTKKKIAETKNKPLMVNGIVYKSWKEASQHTSIPMGSISYLLKSKPCKGKWSAYELKEMS
jgi:group I intron endonuclease